MRTWKDVEYPVWLNTPPSTAKRLRRAETRWPPSSIQSGATDLAQLGELVAQIDDTEERENGLAIVSHLEVAIQSGDESRDEAKVVANWGICANLGDAESAGTRRTSRP